MTALSSAHLSEHRVRPSASVLRVFELLLFTLLRQGLLQVLPGLSQLLQALGGQGTLLGPCLLEVLEALLFASAITDEGLQGFQALASPLRPDLGLLSEEKAKAHQLAGEASGCLGHVRDDRAQLLRRCHGEGHHTLRRAQSIAGDPCGVIGDPFFGICEDPVGASDHHPVEAFLPSVQVWMVLLAQPGIGLADAPAPGEEGDVQHLVRVEARGIIEEVQGCPDSHMPQDHQRES
mmetsp:Transcript_127257/g.179612  ORF Transcript_127257/g.179612 Transcript_127257/m.179612 type:complete len:235 (+) Transcript_127257:112-816(+)